MKKFINYNLRHVVYVLLLSLFVVACSDDDPIDPTGDFTYEVSSVNSLMVSFEATATDGITLFWDFGDGGESIAVSAEHTYKVGGTYTVTLTIFGEEGSTPAVIEKSFTLVAPTFEEIAVVNADFELPGDAKQTNWAGVAGWSSDTEAADSGVEANGWWDGETDNYRGYQKSTDPAVFNLTDHVISDGEELKVQLDAFDVWNGSQIVVSLYYDNGDGVRNVIATQTFDLVASEWNNIVLTALATAESAGGNLGIEISNVSTDGDDGWTGFDNVQLFVK